MRFRQIEDHREVWPVRVMCDALSVSPSGYYAWRSRPESPRKIANRELLADIRRVHARHRERYGAPRIYAELRAEGQTASRKRVARLMRQHGIRARAPRRFRVCTTDSKHSLPVAENLLDQNFVADRPDHVWLADITYIPTAEGWLYLAVILDLFTRKVVGWAMREHMRAELTIAALTMAIQRRRPKAGLIHHPPSATSPPNRRRQNPRNPVSTFPGKVKRVLRHPLLHRSSKTVEALSHVGAPNRQPYPSPRRQADHRSSTLITRARAAALTVLSTMTRRPLPSTISIRPGVDIAVGGGSAAGSGAMYRRKTPPCSPRPDGRPAPSCARQKAGSDANRSVARRRSHSLPASASRRQCPASPTGSNVAGAQS